MLSVREYMEASADHRQLTDQEKADAVGHVTDLACDEDAPQRD